VVGPLLARFSRVALVTVAVVIITGTAASLMTFAGVSDLWRYGYGRAVLAKAVLVAVAVAIASRHRAASFGRTAKAELLVVTAALGLAAGLVVMVPGRSQALVANGPVSIERRAGSYTVQLTLDPSRVGPNQLHVTFVDAQGLGAAEVQTVSVTLGTGPVAMRLIAPGHFVGDVDLPRAGRYRITVSTPSGGSITFAFTLKP
jgi:hypothetical protein